MLKMELCLNSRDDLIEAFFSTRERAEAWLRENHPGFFRRGVWFGEGEGWFQYGTGYYWATFVTTSATLVPDEVDKGLPPN